MRVLFGVVALVAVLALAACVVLLRNRSGARERVLALFKRPEAARPLGADHYYRPYWAPGPDRAAGQPSDAGSGSPRPGA